MRPLAAVLVAAALAAGPACSRSAVTQGPGTDSAGFTPRDRSATVVPVSRRVAAPRLTGPGVDGGPVDTGSYAGRVLVLNFWASWCAPCRAETPGLVGVAADTASRGVAFVGVDFRDTRANAAAFRRTARVGYPSLFDPDGTTLARFRSLPPSAIPTTLVLDRRGRVAARFLSPVLATELLPVLDRVAAEPA